MDDVRDLVIEIMRRWTNTPDDPEICELLGSLAHQVGVPAHAIVELMREAIEAGAESGRLT